VKFPPSSRRSFAELGDHRILHLIRIRLGLGNRIGRQAGDGRALAGSRERIGGAIDLVGGHSGSFILAQE
jgi:hypothetical protein